MNNCGFWNEMKPNESPVNGNTRPDCSEIEMTGEVIKTKDGGTITISDMTPDNLADAINRAGVGCVAFTTGFPVLVSSQLASDREKYKEPVETPWRGYRLLVDEMGDLCDVVVSDEQVDKPAILHELTQIAARCQRIVEDCGLMAKKGE